MIFSYSFLAAAARHFLSPPPLPLSLGEAMYVDDMPLPPRSLHAAYVLSTKAHAKLLKINSDKALALPAVVDFITAKVHPHLSLFPHRFPYFLSSFRISRDRIFGDQRQIGTRSF